MKISNPARWGILLLAALLAAATLVASEDTPCSTIDDCPEKTYCNSVASVCLTMGGCVEPADCDDPTNFPYEQVMCLGTTICEGGRCGIDCGVFDDEDSQEGKLKCRDHSDCKGDGFNAYCASDGFCERIGGCAVKEDCELEENQGYPIAACFGSLECTDRTCGMNCSGGSDALFMCTTSEDCRGSNEYCNTMDTCRPMGACMVDQDCLVDDNSYAMIECVGRVFCARGSVCAKACGEPQGTLCETGDDCGVGDYCAENGICQEHGFCEFDGDCLNPANEFLVAACVGPLSCENGMCSKTCASAAAPDMDAPCETSDDCSGDLFCSTNGKCMESGSCGRVEDCSSPDNIFPSIACLGAFTCNDGSCGKVCGEPCSDSSECSGSDYCASNGICLPEATCAIPEDCTADGNFVMLPACVGAVTCDEGMCGKVCGDPCADNSECRGSTYCASTGTCLPIISCAIPDDCNAVGNNFMQVDCIGAATCEEGMCGIVCGDPCADNSECAQGDYCASNGICLPSMSCAIPDDCTATGNDIMMPACVGTVTCDEGMCGKVCDGIDESKSDNASAVDIEISGMSCTSDADCNSMTTSTARSATPDSMYCAQGTCAKQGSCYSDLDCINPVNILWNDKRCFGYLHCTEQGMCDRVCGEDCKSGERAAECFEDVCETNDWSAVEGAVSCTMYKCKGGCDTVLFDATGQIAGLKEAGGDKKDDPKTLPELDKDVLNLESSAMRATSMVAILAAVLAAGMV